MKLGIIIQTNNPEQAWNALRFANTSLVRGHEVKIYLMSAGVEIESITHEKYNARQQLESFVQHNGIVLACGTCIQARKQGSSEICPISNMNDCVEMVEWADRMVTF